MSKNRTVTWIQSVLAQDFFDSDFESDSEKDAVLRQAFVEGTLERHIRQIVRDEIYDQQLLADYEDSASPPPASSVLVTTVEKPKRKRQLTYLACAFESKLRTAIASAVVDWNVTVAGIARSIDGIWRNTLDLHLVRYKYKRPGETTLQTLKRLADEWHPGWRDRLCTCKTCQP